MCRYVALIPAAGCGSRAQTVCPKQYVMLDGRPVLHHTIQTIINEPRIDDAFVILDPNDDYFNTFDWTAFAKRLSPLWCGGKTRQESVTNALKAIRNLCDPNDWILVHDAARPLLTPSTLSRFLDTLDDDPIGGLLAVKVRDTMKSAMPSTRSSDVCVEHTIDRTHLWHAQTPQMFRYHLLYTALTQQGEFSDEASAVEALGVSPRLIPGEHLNIKITYPEDIRMAKALLDCITLDSKHSST